MAGKWIVGLREDVLPFLTLQVRSLPLQVPFLTLQEAPLTRQDRCLKLNRVDLRWDELHSAVRRARTFFTFPASQTANS